MLDMIGASSKTQISGIPTVTIGGLPIIVSDRAETADRMLRAAAAHEKGQKPLFCTSANGEVISRCATDQNLKNLFLMADEITADGQPMVAMSRFLCRHPLPERVATTDLFHDAAKKAQLTGQSFYLLGATQSQNDAAVTAVKKLYPDLKIAGHCHGYLKGDALEAKLAEIDRLAPDILWLAMGVPHEQRFVAAHSSKLTNVGVIKTSGGLFNFLSGKNTRAPALIQAMGLEWVFRILLEPRRLFWRYLTTNPHALWLILTNSH